MGFTKLFSFPMPVKMSCAADDHKKQSLERLLRGSRPAERLKLPQGALAVLPGNKQMVMVICRDGIDADPGRSQPGSDRRQEAHRIQRGMHGQPDARPGTIVGQAQAARLRLRQDQRDTFWLVKKANRRTGQPTKNIRGDRTKHKSLLMQHGLHGCQQSLEIGLTVHFKLSSLEGLLWAK